MIINDKKNIVFPTIFLILVNGVFLFFTWSFYQLRTQHRLEEAQSRTQDIYQRLRLRFESYLNVSETIRERFRLEKSLDFEKLDLESLYIRSSFYNFQAINFVDPEGVIVWVSPLEGNEKALNGRLMERDDIGPILNHPDSRRIVSLSPPIELLQKGVGVVFYMPLRLGGEFQGWINIVFRLDRFVDALFSADEKSQYRLTIKDNASQLVLYNNNKTSKTAFYSNSFPFYNRHWTIELYPNRQDYLTPYVIIALLFVLFLSLFLALALKKYLDHWDRVKADLDEAISETTLLRTLSHDLNTPLTIAGLILDRMKNSTDPVINESVAQLRTNMERQATMLKGVRELQLHRYRSEFQKREKVDAAVSIKRVIEEVQPILVKKNIQIHFEQKEDALYLTGLDYCLEQHILTNLVVNAIKYSPKDSMIKIRAYKINGEIYIEFEDQGPGIPDLVLDQVNLGKIPNSVPGSARESGTGFGLLLVQNFVRLLGGKIYFSNSSTGSLIQLRFKEFQSST
jgi:signal transduction histidine kinase